MHLTKRDLRSQKVDIHVHIWDEGEEHVITNWDGNFSWDRISDLMEEKLMTREYGAVIRTYADGEIGIYCRAFTDEHRGRIIVCAASETDVDKHFEERKKQCAMKVFTPNQLYALCPVRVDYDTYMVVNDFIDSAIDSHHFDYAEADKLKMVEFRELVFRGEWSLGSVWFNAKPVMVVNCSGKDCEEKDRWITDAALYSEMIEWLTQFAHRSEVTGFVKADSIIPAMTEFGGATIHDFYNVETQEAKKWLQS